MRNYESTVVPLSKLQRRKDTDSRRFQHCFKVRTDRRCHRRFLPDRLSQCQHANMPMILTPGVTIFLKTWWEKKAIERASAATDKFQIEKDLCKIGEQISSKGDKRGKYKDVIVLTQKMD